MEPLATNLLTTTLEQGKKMLHFDEGKARAALEDILRQPLFPEERQQVMNAAVHFASYWFTSRFAQRYQLLSPDIFKLTRTVINEEGYQIQIPTLFSVHIDHIKGGVAIHRTENIECEGKRGSDRQKLRVSAVVPEYPIEARAAYIAAQQFTCELTRLAYEDPLLQRILEVSRHERGNNDSLFPYTAETIMIWAPEQVEISKIWQDPPRDPALVMVYNGNHFVIHVWDCAEERPIDAFIRELQITLAAALDDHLNR